MFYLKPLTLGHLVPIFLYFYIHRAAFAWGTCWRTAKVDATGLPSLYWPQWKTTRGRRNLEVPFSRYGLTVFFQRPLLAKTNINWLAKEKCLQDPKGFSTTKDKKIVLGADTQINNWYIYHIFYWALLVDAKLFSYRYTEIDNLIALSFPSDCSSLFSWLDNIIYNEKKFFQKHYIHFQNLYALFS